MAVLERAEGVHGDLLADRASIVASFVDEAMARLRVPRAAAGPELSRGLRDALASVFAGALATEAAVRERSAEPHVLSAAGLAATYPVAARVASRITVRWIEQARMQVTAATGDWGDALAAIVSSCSVVGELVFRARLASGDEWQLVPPLCEIAADLAELHDRARASAAPTDRDRPGAAHSVRRVGNRRWLAVAGPERLCDRELARRLGAVAALGYAVRARNLHFAKLGPRDLPLLLLTAGTLCQGQLQHHPNLDGSVLRTGVLAIFDRAPSGLVDHGALTASVRERGAQPRELIEALIQGFEETYAQVLVEREALLAADGAFARLAGGRSVYVTCPPHVVARIREASLSSSLLADEAQRGMMLDVWLARAHGGVRAANDEILRSERRSVERGEPPVFRFASRAVALACGEREVSASWFARPPGDDLRRHVLAMSDADKAVQVALIRASVEPARSRGAGEGSPSDANGRPLPGGARWLPRAAQIGRELASRAIRPVGDRGPTWLSAASNEIGQLELIALGPELYGGTVGTAVFLAALDQAGGEARHQALITEILVAARAHVAERAREPGPLGGMTGEGGLLYGLIVLARFCHRSDALVTAIELAERIDGAAIARDRTFDVMAGAAGSALALLALWRATGDDRWRDRADRCGQHLLHRVQRKARGVAWHPTGGVALGGFAHGVAGIAYALASLYHATAHPVYRITALQAVEYEASTFCDGNWLDLRQSTPELQHAWCHGSAGIALSRAGMLGLGAHAVARDLALAVAATQQSGELPYDHLCCGNLGRCEALLVASSAVGDPVLAEHAAAIAERAAARNWRLELDDAVWTSGLWGGLAGIGYQLLRLSNPQLPCLLLME